MEHGERVFHNCARTHIGFAAGLYRVAEQLDLFGAAGDNANRPKSPAPVVANTQGVTSRTTPA